MLRPNAMRFFLQSIMLLIGLALGGVFIDGYEQADASDASLWQGLQSGQYIAFISHGLALGNNDADNFRISDCSTQRDLSVQGREQIKSIGERLRAHGITQAHIFSSQWCRCLDTARLLDLGDVQPLQLLNSFYHAPEHSAEQTKALHQWLHKQSPTLPLLLITHQSNIAASTGMYPDAGEIVVVKQPSKADQTLEVVGTIKPMPAQN